MTLTALSQFDTGPYASGNCSSTVGAMLVAFATGNRKHPTGSQFRANVRNLQTGTPDTSGGINNAQIVETAKRAYGVTLDASNMDADDAWILSKRSDLAVGWSILYRVVSGTIHDGSPGFEGNHEVLLNAGLVYDPLADGRRDGIPQAPEKWTKTLLVTAAGKLNIAGPGDIERGINYRPLGAGRALVVVAKAPAISPKRYSVAFTAGSFWRYTPGTPITRLAKSFSHATSAPCEAPTLIPFNGVRKRLVRVTAGVLKGYYVAPGESHVRLTVG